jgi:CHAD domain-containing protein
MKRPLERLIDELFKAEKKARRRGKPEDWHRLRTTSRRLRGALIAHADGLAPEDHRRLARQAKRITKLPTKVRDLDVALENLSSLRASATSDDEREAARQAQKGLARKRDRSARKARRILKRERPVDRLARTLRRGHPARGQDGPGTAALAACARAVLDRRAELRGWAHGEEVHRLRVAVKKYRGALMAIDGHHPALEELQRVQQVLGEHHDWSELARRLASRKKSRPGLPTLIARARDEQRARFERYQHELEHRLAHLVGAGRERLALVATR